ncbi:MAG: right-handed parallel beta-helix repeat-containing protein [Gemmatimonadaceae bacterium]
MSRRRGSAVASAALILVVAIISPSCHVADVMAPGRVGEIALAFTGDSSVIAGSRTLPPITVTNGGTAVPSPLLLLASSDTTVVSIAHGDSLVGRTIGEATITATLASSLFPADGPKLTQRVWVVPKALVVTPASVHFESIGDTLTLTAVATDANGTLLTSVPVKWVSANDSIAHLTGARVTAARADSTEIRAIVGWDTVHVPVIVRQRVASYSFAFPLMVLNAIGAETTLVAIAHDAHGFAIANAPPPIWESSDTTRATVSAAGVLHALANSDASARVYARARRVDGSDSLLVVIDQVATRVAITPANGTTINSIGGKIRLGAFAYDRLGQNVTDGPPHWESRQPAIARSDTSQGLSVFVTGLGTGNATIIARTDGAADSVSVRVLNEPTSIVIKPDSALLRSAGDTLRGVRATVFNGQGDSIPGAVVSWLNPDTRFVRLLPDGGVIALDSGRARIIGQITTTTGNQLADTAIVAVTNSPALARMLVAADTLVYLGDTVTTAIRIENARGAALPPTRLRWSSSNPLIATADATGRVTANAVGSTWIFAASDPPAVSDSMQIVVTNLAASIAIDAHQPGAVDTLPGPGAVLPYTATIRTAAGTVVTGFAQQWTSSAPTVATVGADGTVSATGYGNSLITVRAANVFDTVRVVVRHPGKIWIDQSRAGAIMFGTWARPFATMGGGLAIAQPGDTLFVAPNGSYLEQLSVPAALTIAGDSSAFLASGRDPATLPQLTNQSTSAAIAANGAALTVSHLVIRNGSDGAAIATSNSNVTLHAVYVNPGSAATPRGGGIVITGAPTAVVIDSTSVEGTVGSGILVSNSAGVRVTRNRINTIRRAGNGVLEDGAGIAVLGGNSPMVSGNTIRTADGVGILINSASSAAVIANTLRGERQLMLLNGASGSTSVSSNSFDLARPSDDPFTGNSTTDGRSGLEVRSSSSVLISGNSFHDGAGATSLMNAVHLADVRAARLDQNQVIGGRRGVFSERSSWAMLRSRVDSIALTIESSGSDTLSLTDDTLSAAGTACIASRQGELTLTRVILDQCGVGDLPAVGLVGGAIATDLLTMSGTNPRAIVVDSARRALIRRTTVRGPNAATVGIAGNGGIDLTADSTTVTNSFVTGYPDRAGVWLSGGVVRTDSNTVNRSRNGIVIARASVTLDIRDDDLYDADTAALTIPATTPITAPGIWWGDGRGPRGTSTSTAGDTVVGPVTTSPYRVSPLRSGITGTRMRKLRGDFQSAPQLTVLPRPFSVRVTDADGLPVSNKTVTFSVPSTSRSSFNGQKSVNVITNASGIAEATLTLGRNPSDNTVTVTAVGVSDVLNFTVTAF